jgi:predicted alpha/beta-fold hydrolase
VEGIHYHRERISTEDNDFLDLDWSTQGSDRLLVVSHGLEGNSGRAYVKGFVKFFNSKGWDVLAWNCRSCSGEMNLSPRLYHHGAWYDLRDVMDHVNKGKIYRDIGLVGVSMGGSITLRYLAEMGTALRSNIAGGVAVSVPCSLLDSIRALEITGRRFYARRFIRKLKAKLQQKAILFPDLADSEGLKNAMTFADLDRSYSIRVYGYDTVDEFYEHISVWDHLPRIKQDVLIMNAKNDPMLIDDCYPVDLARASKNLFLEMPTYGGHMGFALPGNENSWAEIRTHEFFVQLLGTD